MPPQDYRCHGTRLSGFYWSAHQPVWSQEDRTEPVNGYTAKNGSAYRTDGRSPARRRMLKLSRIIRLSGVIRLNRGQESGQAHGGHYDDAGGLARRPFLPLGG